MGQLCGPGGCMAEAQGKVLAGRVCRDWGQLGLRMSKSPRIQGGAVSHVTTPLDWSRVGIVEKMAAQREPHRSRSVHTAPPSVQEGGEGPGNAAPSSCLDKDRGGAVGEGERGGSVHQQRSTDRAGFPEAARSSGHKHVLCPPSEPSSLTHMKGSGVGF